MGLQTTVIGNARNSPKCNIVPEGKNHHSISRKEKKLLQILPAKELGCC